MYFLKVGQIVYNYTDKYDLYYKITKNFYLKYRDYFKPVVKSGKDNDTISIKFINGVEFHFDASDNKTKEWKRIIKQIQEKQSVTENKDKNFENLNFNNKIECPIERAYKRKKKDSSYLRLFKYKTKIAELVSDLITAVHSTSISEGVKLEQYIFDEFDGEKYHKIKFNDVVKIIKNYESEKTILFKKVIIGKKIINENTKHDHERSENVHLDLLILHKGELFINELKDGESLDTKKSDIEIREIKVIKKLFENVTGLPCSSSIILWTCKNIETSSIKTIEADDYILRGIDLCDTLNINHELIEYKRKNSYEGNLKFVLDKMIEIVDVYKKN
jgi:hypothetical protein